MDKKMENTITIQDFYNADFELKALPNGEASFTIIQKNNKFYTLYLLQDRTLVKKKQLFHMKQILVSEPKIEDLYDLINSKIDIIKFLSKSQNVKLSKINNMTFPQTKLTSISEIKDLLPETVSYLNLDSEYKTTIENYIKGSEN
jgi:hypothetical protein